MTELLLFLELDKRSAPYTISETTLFSILVPLSFARRMRKRDWYDPLLLQVLPRKEETVERKGFVSDAVGDSDAAVTGHLLHKYSSRALFCTSGACAIHCRFCFRREYPFPPGPVDRSAGEAAWRYLERNREITEAVLSGGDPLGLDPADLEHYCRRIVALPRIATVRLHTRLPVADPGRIDRVLLDSISYVNSVKTCIVVVHANHAAELSADCSAALTRLKATGALLLNQSVLLAGVNDRTEALCDLSCALLDHGVLPYYLHQLDRVRGAGHFEVAETEGKAFIREMREKLPGYAVPRYVREVPGERSKRPLA